MILCLSSERLIYKGI